MAINRLTALQVQKLSQSGRYADGGGLFLEIDSRGGKRWLLRIQTNGRRRDFGLGGLRKVSLAEARAEAERYRHQLAQGIDPVAAKKAVTLFGGTPTFRQAAERFHKEYRDSWKNTKHAAQVLSTLETYACPVLGNMPVDEIRGSHIRSALISIWLDKQETARRVRQRIASVMNWSRANGYCDVVLDLSDRALQLPKQTKPVRHHPAIPYQELPALWARISQANDITDMVRQALLFTILTAARSGEVRGASWDEFDLAQHLWTIPAERMKAGRVHRVPLSEPAFAILTKMAAYKTNVSSLVFYSARQQTKPLSDMALLMVLRRLQVGGTVHGFRSTFRDWVAEQTHYPREVAEVALAHETGNKVERAYARTDYLERRIALMNDWAAYCLRNIVS